MEQRNEQTRRSNIDDLGTIQKQKIEGREGGRKKRAQIYPILKPQKNKSTKKKMHAKETNTFRIKMIS
jgi:hypothetical protein